MDGGYDVLSQSAPLFAHPLTQMIILNLFLAVVMHNFDGFALRRRSLAACMLPQQIRVVMSSLQNGALHVESVCECKYRTHFLQNSHNRHLVITQSPPLCSVLTDDEKKKKVRFPLAISLTPIPPRWHQQLPPSTYQKHLSPLL